MADIGSISAPQIPALSQGLDAPSKHDTPEKIEKAAKQFESLLIAQLLKSIARSRFQRLAGRRGRVVGVRHGNGRRAVCAGPREWWRARPFAHDHTEPDEINGCAANAWPG